MSKYDTIVLNRNNGEGFMNKKPKVKIVNSIDKKVRCCNCKYYIQHFIYRNDYGFTSFKCGHCTETLKEVSDSDVCELFKKGKNKYKRDKEITAIKQLCDCERSLVKLGKALTEIKNKICK